MGFPNEKDAKEAYLAHYDSPDFFGGMGQLPLGEFRKVVLEGQETPKGVRLKFKRKARRDRVASRVIGRMVRLVV